MEATMRTKLTVIRFSLLFAAVALLYTGQVLAGPKIQHWLTGNGGRVYFVNAPELPMVDIRVVFDAGAARDGTKHGLALMTNALLPEGADGMNADQISERFDSLGIQFGNSSERDMSLLSMRSLTASRYLQPGLDLLATVLQKPDFPKDAFERERNRLLIAIEQRQQQPGKLASQAFFKAVFKKHPYHTLPEGDTDTVKALNVADLRAFYQQYFVAKNATIAIVGDLDRKQAEAVAEKLLGGLPPGQAAPKLPEVKPLASAETVKIEHPSAQTHILVGQPGVKRGDPDYFPLFVGNHILGGSGLVSRLSDEIREKRGLSYSTYSYFSPMHSEGPFVIGLQTRTSSAKEALDVTRNEVRRFVTQGPTAKELDAAKKNLTGGFPLRISSNKKIVGYIAMIGFYGLPLDYLDTFSSKVDAVTVNDIKDAFQRRVNPDKMVTVLVGKVNGAKAGTAMMQHKQ
jgi:zinc protease